MKTLIVALLFLLVVAYIMALIWAVDTVAYEFNLSTKGVWATVVILALVCGGSYCRRGS